MLQYLFPEPKNPTPARAYLHKDGHSYSFEGRVYSGLSDKVDLPLRVRRQIARWARESGNMSKEQTLLLGALALVPTQYDRLKSAEAHCSNTSSRQRALALADGEESLHLMNPTDEVGHAVTFPISLGLASKILSIPEPLLLEWDSLGIVRAPRWGNKRYRGYARQHLFMAIMVKKALISGYSLTQIRAALGLIPMPEQDSLVTLQKLKHDWDKALL